MVSKNRRTPIWYYANGLKVQIVKIKFERRIQERGFKTKRWELKTSNRNVTIKKWVGLSETIKIKKRLALQITLKVD